MPEKPQIDGPVIFATPLPIHHLKWLEEQDCAVSRGRGWAKTIELGTFSGELPISEREPIHLILHGINFCAALEIRNNFCQIRSRYFPVDNL